MMVRLELTLAINLIAQKDIVLFPLFPLRKQGYPLDLLADNRIKTSKTSDNFKI